MKNSGRLKRSRCSAYHLKFSFQILVEATMAKAIVDSWVVAPSKNIKRSIQFYSKLGFKPSRRMQDYVEFKVPGGTVLGLYSAEREKIKKHGGSGAMGWGIMLRV